MLGVKKKHQPLALYHFDLDVHFPESLQHEKALDQQIQHILYFGRFWIDPFNEWTNFNVEPPENKYFIIWRHMSKEHMILQ